MVAQFWQRWVQLLRSRKPYRPSSTGARRGRRRLLAWEALEDRIAPATWSGDVFDASPGVPLWTNSAVQEITANVHVPAGKTLTVQAGTVVKFDGGTSLTVDGTLLAQGAAGQTIYFTSIQDNSVGGGSGGTPAPGQWGRILFTSTSTDSVLDQVVVRYGGANADGEVEADGTAPSISNSTIGDALNFGLRLSGSNAALVGDTFQNNGLLQGNGVGGAVHIDVTSQPVITGSTFTNNFVNAVWVDPGSLPAGTTSWSNADAVYYLPRQVTVPAGSTLALGAGQVLKFYFGQSLVVQGTLNAQGTAAQPVVLTAYTDDSAGGDTNNNGSATSPSAGSWNQLLFTSTSTNSVLSHVEVRYGGNGVDAEVEADGTAPSISNSTIGDALNFGLRLSGSNATLVGDTFQNNGLLQGNGVGGAVHIDVTSQPVITGSTFTNNFVNAVWVDPGSLPAGTTSWSNADAVYYLPRQVTVPAGSTLALGAGQVLKFYFGQSLVVQGTLNAQGTAAQPVVLTAYTDDSAGGDTNNNGSATSPSAGSWNQLLFTSTSTNSVLSDVEVRYGGNGVDAEVEADGTSVSLSHSVIQNASSYGLRLQGAAATLTGNTFQNNGNAGGGGAIHIDLASQPAIDGIAFTNNHVNGVVVDGGTLAGNLTLTGQNVVYSLGGSATIQPGVTLTVGAQTVLSVVAGANILGPGTLANAGTFLKAADSGTMTVAAAFANTGTLEIDNGTLNLTGNLTINGSGFLTGQAAGTLAVAGNLGGNTQAAVQLAPLAALVLDGSGTAAAPQTLEVMSRDLGHAAAGFSRNFVYYRVALANGTHVRLVDSVRNSTGTGPEALYADNLVVPAGTTLDLNGLHVYTRVAQVDGTVSGGTLTPLPSGGPLVLNATAAGSLAATATDDWTFFGRAGQAITAVVNTGSGGSPTPLPPTLGYAQVTLLDPSGHALATASNTQTGADVTLTGVALAADGTYHLKVQAPSAQPNSAGNYVLTAWDATPRTAALGLDATTTGTLDTPYRIDQFTFTAAAAQAVRFNLLNVANPSIVFDLTGPNGYTAFAGATASSAVLALPAAGTYTLTVHSTQHQTGAYAFQLANASVTDLTLGTPVTATIAGSGQAQLFRLVITQPGQVQLTLQDNTRADQNELYANLGSVPTRAKYHPWYSTGASASKQMSIPTAAAGTYYILVYTESAPTAGQFTLTANEANVFLTGVTPDHAGNGGDLSMTLTGTGFDNTATVSLVSSGNTVYSAGTTNFDLPTQLTATFAKGTVPAGVYSVKVTLGSGASATLPNAFTFIAGGQANFVADLIVPNPIGLHIASTIYVNYTNAGTVAMPAPLLILTAEQNGTAGALMTLDPALRTSGFWTSATPRGYGQTVQFLAAGATPGVLQPGESATVPVYYAGWLRNLWDFSRPPINFHLGLLTADSTAAVDWASMKASLQPAGVSANAWDGIYPNFTAQLGNTWGSVIGRLDQDAAYLGSVGEKVTDIEQLWSFELQQANGFGPVPTLAAAVDLAVPSIGLPLAIGRSFASSIIGRNVTGPFGNGWQLGGGWDRTLTVQGDGTVVIAGADGPHQVFQPDSRNGGYFANGADFDTLANLGGGIYTLTSPTGVVTEFQNGQVAFIADTNGNKITAGYTGGLLTSLTASSGPSLMLTYNAAGRVIKLTNSLGQTATYAYDPTNQYLLSATDLDGYTTRYTYNVGTSPETNLALRSITNPDGTQSLFAYDIQGRLSQVSLQGGAQAVSFGFGVGGTVTATDAMNHTATYFFDNRGLVARFIDPLQNATFYTYDANGNLITATDPAGAIYSYVCDSQGNRIESTNPLGNTVHFTYGPLHRLTSTTDPKGNTTQYQYDQNGNLRSTSYADGTIEKMAYDPLGQLMQSTDGNKNVIGYAYNSAGQLATKTYADSSQVLYGYDALGNLHTVQDAAGTITLTYDSANRLKLISYPDGTSLVYSYDTAGRRTQMVDQSGFTVNYTYNTLGQLSGLTDGSGNPIVSYTYDADGRISVEAKGNHTTTTYTYDAAGHTLSIVNAAPDSSVNSSFVYAYNNLGLATTETTLQGKWTYTYDATGQLTHAVFASNNPGQVPNQDLQYIYDAAGNRTSTIINDVTTAYTVNNRNEYTLVGATAYAYDANGNLMSQAGPAGNTTFAYNADSRLVAVHPPTGTASSFQYDAFGSVYLATQDGQQTRHLTDPLSENLVGQFDTSGGVLAHYTYGLGLISQVSAAGASSYYDYDLRGSTVGLTNAAGAYINTYSYLPFGEITSAVAPVANPFQFVGRSGVLAIGTNLSLMGARAYVAGTGQFAADDPLGVLGKDFNVRRYASNNPVQYIDPHGLQSRLVPDPQNLGNPSSSGQNNPGQADSDMQQLLNRNNPGQADSDMQQLLNGQTDARRQILQTHQQITQDQEVTLNNNNHDPGGSPLSPAAGGNLPPVTTILANPPVVNAPPAGPTKNVGDTSVNNEDPNSLFGPAGFGPGNFIAANDQPLPYRINFENDPTATAPAQIVTVTDPLSTNLDWSTFQLTAVGFGDTNVNIPAGTRHFQTTVPMTYNGKTFNVAIELGIHTNTGQVYASFLSLDPNTDLPPDILTGFLPPEDGTGRGMGYFSDVVAPKPGLPSGTQIRNVALVTFDPNPPIATDQVNEQDPSQGTDPAKQALVTIDAGAPSSSVAALPAFSSTSYTVRWSGSDDTGGSGIAFYNVFVSDNGGPFTPWLTATTQTAATFTGQADHRYGFVSVATDNVGNAEAMPTAAQATTTIDAIAPTSTVVALPSFAPGSFTLAWSGSDNAGGSGLASYSIYVSIDGGTFTRYLSDTTQTSTTFTGTDGHRYGFYSRATDNAGNPQAAPATAQATTTVDTAPPGSSVAALPATENTTGFVVTWSGSDSAGGSGLASYTVYVSDNGGMSTALLRDTRQTSTLFPGRQGHTYGFYTSASDNVGNTQPTPATAQATTAVTADAASQLAVALQPPAKVTAGASFRVTINALQANGQLDPHFNGPIALLLGAAGPLAGPTTVVATAGVATFTGLALAMAGSGYALVASGTALAAATSRSFNVLAAPATHLVVTAQPPASAAAHAGFELAVTAEDAFGNVAGTWPGPVSLTLSGGGKLLGKAAVTPHNGVATFTGLMIDTTGTYTVQASSGSLTPDVSSPLTVTPGAATRLVVTTPPPASVNASAPFGLTLTAEDGFGNVDPNYSSAVTLVLSGNGTLSGAASMPASGGIALFSGLSIGTPGTGAVLQASAPGVTGTATGKFAVAANLSDQLLVTTEPPAHVTAGSAFTLVVKVFNGERVDTHFNKPIALVLGGSARLAGPTTVTAQGGVATFGGLSIGTAGHAYTLRVSAAGLTAVTTTPFAVAAGAVTKLAITMPPPTSIMAGAPFGLTIMAEDAFGNVNSTFNTGMSLALSRNPGKALLNGTVSSPVQAGVASFTGLNLLTAASGYVLTATSGRLTVSTGSLTVTPGSAAQLVFATQPAASVKAGSAFTVTVLAKDSYGNVDSGFNGSVSLGWQNNPGNALLHGPVVVSARGGVAVFTGLALNAAGSGYTLSATAGTFAPVNSNGITVTPAAATQLMVTVQPPPSTRAGTGFGLTVTAQDAFGNVVTSFAGTIKLTLSGGSRTARLSGGAGVSAKAGVAVFQGLTINTAAHGYLIKVAGGGLTTSTDGFDILA